MERLIPFFAFNFCLLLQEWQKWNRTSRRFISGAGSGSKGLKQYSPGTRLLHLQQPLQCEKMKIISAKKRNQQELLTDKILKVLQDSKFSCRDSFPFFSEEVIMAPRSFSNIDPLMSAEYFLIGIIVVIISLAGVFILTPQGVIELVRQLTVAVR